MTDAGISPLRWIKSLLKAPEVSPEQTADRIRFMERDVCLTIKVIVLGALAYIFLSNWFEGVSTIGELGIESVRGAFRVYLVANILIGLMLLAMDYLPVWLVQWSVFVLNIVDGTFVALLVIITGGLESAIYWVFLVLVIRCAVSITQVRLQVAVNLFIVLCYLFAGVLDLTMQELRSAQQEVETDLEHAPKPVVKPNARPPVDEDPPIDMPRKPRRQQTPDSDHIDLGRALVLAIAGFSDGRVAQSLFIRILLLLLLALSAYGINVLADLQLQAEAEAREFAFRQEQLRSTGRLAAEIAHQLKNPLAIINNAAFSLQKSFKDAKPAQLQQVEMIREEVGRSDRILTQLMGYAQLAEGRVERLQIREEIQRALDRVFPTALVHEVKIEVNCPDGLPPCSCNGRIWARFWATFSPTPGMPCMVRDTSGSRPRQPLKVPSKSPLPTTDQASPRTSRSTSLNPTSPPRRKAPAWGWPSSGTTRRFTVAGLNSNPRLERAAHSGYGSLRNQP